jgi:hypothetical protein
LLSRWLNATLSEGLFGAKVHQRRDLIQGLTKVMVHLGKDVTLIEDRALDQVLLSQLFWPIAKDDAVSEFFKNFFKKTKQ